MTKGNFMRVNNIQRSKIITTNRRIDVNGANRNTVTFGATPKNAEEAAKTVKTAAQAVKPLLPQRVIDRFGLNMTTAVNYKGKPSYTPAPDTVAPDIKRYFHMLEVNWSTRIDPKKPKKKF